MCIVALVPPFCNAVYKRPKGLMNESLNTSEKSYLDSVVTLTLWDSATVLSLACIICSVLQRFQTNLG